MKNYDVIIVGASFAGISCAKEIAQHGLSVAVLERKKDIEKAIHTTGILAHEAADLLNLPQHLFKKISQVRLYSSSLRYREVKSDKYVFLATDTPKMIQHMLEEAQESGVHFYLGTPFKNATRQDNIIYVNDHAYSCWFLIGADGCKSKVAEVFNLGKNTRCLVGAEIEYTGIEIENEDAFYCFIDKKFAPGYIAWVIPGPKVLQIGLAQLSIDKFPNRIKENMQKFMQHIEKELKLKNPVIVEKRGGLIPIGGLVEPFYRDNVILVGDAAGIVSPLTAGGIHTALFYGKKLGKLTVDYLNGQAVHPGEILKREYPRFRFKHILRWIFEKTPTWYFDFVLNFPGFHYFAKAVFFLKKRLPTTNSRPTPRQAL